MSGTRVDRLARDLAAKAARLEVPQDMGQRFAKYARDPVLFARRVLGVKKLPAYQAAVLKDVAAHERTAWVGGHATGKSLGAAVLLAWYLCTRPGARCLVTSATFERQVGRVIFAKLAALVAGAREPLPLEVSVTRAQVTGHPEWAAEGVPATKPGNFSGFHASRMLVIADEAKALDRATFEEIQGNLASAVDEARLVLLSTAGPAAGYFYERFAKHGDTWRLHRTPSTASPFARGFAERMAEECLGENDPIYRMRVLAEFAEDVEGQLLPLSAIQAAIGREVATAGEGEVTLGVDVARFGDDRTVVAVREGARIVSLEAWRGLDLMRTADRVASVANSRHAARVYVDEIGLGAGVLDRLRDLGVPAEGVNVGGAPRRPDTFANVRGELGWALRAQFERGELGIPDDPALVSELAALRYQYDARGRIQLEPKDAAKARLGRSPDLADAVTLTLAGLAGGAALEVGSLDVNEQLTRASGLTDVGGGVRWPGADSGYGSDEANAYYADHPELRDT